MKLVTFKPRGGSPQAGAVVGERIVNLAEASAGRLPNSVRSLLELGDAGLALAGEVAQSGATASESVALSEVKLLAPIPDPSKVLAIGLNYMDHIRETNSKVPSIPIMFTKLVSSIIGPGDAIRWDPNEATKVDWECELAVVIGKRARHVAEADAYDYIAGYMNANDVSARDLQSEKGDQWIHGKSLDTFCPLGPYLVTKDEVTDPHNLTIRTIVNGQTMQDSNTKELLYKIPHLIAYLSRAFTLLPGDVIVTGTPPGVGMGMKPPVWLKHGDEVTIETQGLGRLTNPCVEEQ